MLFIISARGNGQSSTYFKEQIFDDKIEDIKISIADVVWTKSDTSSLNKLFQKFNLPTETDSFMRIHNDARDIRRYKAKLLNSINYLISSESISYDSTIVRVNRHNATKELVKVIEPTDLDIIKNNSLLLSVEELGLIYDYKTKEFDYEEVWIEEILNYANLLDGDRTVSYTHLTLPTICSV